MTDDSRANSKQTEGSSLSLANNAGGEGADTNKSGFMDSGFGKPDKSDSFKAAAEKVEGKDKGLLYGAGKGIGAMTAGTFTIPLSMMEKPSQSLQGLGNIARHPLDTANNVADNLSSSWNSGNSEKRGELIGETIAGAGMLGIGMKGAASTLKHGATNALEARSVANALKDKTLANSKMLTTAQEPTKATMSQVTGKHDLGDLADQSLSDSANLALRDTPAGNFAKDKQAPDALHTESIEPKQSQNDQASFAPPRDQAPRQNTPEFQTPPKPATIADSGNATITPPSNHSSLQLNRIDQPVSAPRQPIVRSEVQAPVTRPEPQAPVSRPEPQAPVSRPEVQAPVSRPEVQAPVSRPEPQAPVSRPEVQAPVSRPEPQAPVSRPEVQAPVSRPEPQAPVSRPEPQAPLSRPEPQAPLSRPEPQAPVSRPEPQAPVSRLEVRKAQPLTLHGRVEESVANYTQNPLRFKSEPRSEAPAPAKPAVIEPRSEAPAPAKPAVIEPRSEAPAPAKPAVSEPRSEAPAPAKPAVIEPRSEAPAPAKPAVIEPRSEAPAPAKPAVSEPRSEAPAPAKSVVSEPRSEPPAPAKPAVSELRSEHPAPANKPAVIEPRSEAPAPANKPAVSEPRSEAPAPANKPAVSELRSEAPAPAKPAVIEPRSEAPAPAKPAVSEPRSEPPAPAKPAVSEPRSEAPAPAKPAVSEPRSEPPAPAPVAATTKLSERFQAVTDNQARPINQSFREADNLATKFDQTNNAARQMIAQPNSASFNQAARQFSQAANDFNRALRESAAADLPKSHIEQMTISPKDTIQAGREYMANVTAPAKVISTRDQLISSAQTSATANGLNKSYATNIEAAANQYVAADTALGRRTASKALVNQIDEFEKALANASLTRSTGAEITADSRAFADATRRLGIVPETATTSPLRQQVTALQESVSELRSAQSAAKMGDGFKGVINRTLDTAWNNPYASAAYTVIGGLNATSLLGRIVQTNEQHAKVKTESESSKKVSERQDQNSHPPVTLSRTSDSYTSKPGTEPASQTWFARQSPQVIPPTTTPEAINSRPMDYSTANSNTKPYNPADALFSTLFGFDTTPKGQRTRNRMLFGGSDVEFAQYYKGPGSTAAPTDTPEVPISNFRSFIKADLDQIERPTNRSFDWRKTQLTPSMLANRQTIYLPGIGAGIDSSTGRLTGQTAKQDSNVISRQYPFLAATAENIKSQHAQDDRTMEASEALNTDFAMGGPGQPTVPANSINAFTANNATTNIPTVAPNDQLDEAMNSATI